ncbi:hypothetical protein DEH81_12520 [Pectobacterium zantedeschiae]|nr:hypothetical protein DEH81_12520 [Pectobacterium zantedeschiae]
MVGKNQGGFTYLFVLLALTVLAGMLLKSQESVQTYHRQQQEEELLFRGEQIRQAIEDYQSASYGNGCYAVSVEQLLEDRRSSKVHYHLRHRFIDPLTGNQQWGMIYDPQGRWIGVRTQGHGRPLRKEGFSTKIDASKFKKAKDYAEWMFTVKPDASAPLPSACKGNMKRNAK